MEKLLISGGASLSGTITCSGAKNAALPMIAATILSNENIVLKNSTLSSRYYHNVRTSWLNGS